MASPRRVSVPATILVVEDHDDSREALAQLISSLGYHVVLARNGAEALRFLPALHPDLILCDLRMPRMDGFEFMAALRHDSKLAKLNVVAVTAFGDAADRRQTAAAGFVDHVTKPIDYDSMVSALDRLLGPRPRS